MLADPELVGLAVEALYGQALLLGYHPIRPADAALLNRSFLGSARSCGAGAERACRCERCRISRPAERRRA